MDGGDWWATVHGVAKSWTRLSDFTFTFHSYVYACEGQVVTYMRYDTNFLPGSSVDSKHKSELFLVKVVNKTLLNF